MISPQDIPAILHALVTISLTTRLKLRLKYGDKVLLDTGLL